MKSDTDITEKIRSAIKAKLGQIGAYVDDELPDYIMVMIANKKTIEQISEDLSLFLGSKTERFTAWLDRLLKKLQAVDGDNEKPSEEDKKSEKPVKNSQKKFSSKDESGISRTELVRKSDEDETNKTRKRRSDEMSKPTKDKTNNPSNSGSSPKPSTSHEPIEDAVVVQQDSGEFEEVVNDAAEAPNKETEDDNKVRVTNDRKLIKTSTGENVPVRKVREELLRERYRRTQSKRRQGMTSVVASVNLRASESESDDEEFRSASEVNVVRRHKRSPVKSRGQEKLLVRACREATSSTGQRDHFPRADDRDHHYVGASRPFKDDRRGFHNRLDEGRMTRDYEHVGDISHISHREYTSRRYRRRPRLASHLVATATQTSPLTGKTEPLAEKTPKEVEAKVDVVKRIETESENDVKNGANENGADSKMREQTPENNRTIAGSNSIYDYDERKMLQYQQQQQRQLPPKRLSDEFHSAGARVPEPYNPENPFIVKRDSPVPDDSDASVEEVVTDIRRVQCDRVYDEYKLRSESPMYESEDNIYDLTLPVNDHERPKFIVTLDGGQSIPSRTIALPEFDDSEQSLDNLPMTSTPLDVKRKNYTGKNDNNNETVMDKIGKSLDELVPDTQKNIRCKFWPACKSGAACPFVHPSVPCYTFPNCSFGSKCLYIHPNCRYDAQCIDMDCPYMHASQRDPLTLVAARIMKSIPQQAPLMAGLGQQCRFYPSCFNTQCPFVHPRECRYGAECRNRSDGCPFKHPPMPLPERFKWCNSDKFVISQSDGSKTQLP